MLHPSAVLVAGGNDINSGGVDAAVAENICQLGDVFFKAIENSCKKVAQIVWKYFFGTDTCIGT